jgi:hypothetical protein
MKKNKENLKSLIREKKIMHALGLNIDPSIIMVDRIDELVNEFKIKFQSYKNDFEILYKLLVLMNDNLHEYHTKQVINSTLNENEMIEFNDFIINLNRDNKIKKILDEKATL